VESNPFQILREIKSVSLATVSDGIPQVRIIDVISEGEIYRFDGEHCLECGRCKELCPAEAIETGDGL
jgi:ferredoxin